MGREGGGVGAYPAFAGHRRAVLFRMAILRHDVRWRSGDDRRASRADHHRGDGGVIRQCAPVGELTCETVGALERLGGTRGGAIKGHQELIPEHPETVEQMLLLTVRKDLNEDGVKMARGDGSKEGADMIVAGHLGDTKQGMGVLASFGFLEPPLVRQKRGRLGQEDTKGAESGVLHPVSRLVACTMLRQWLHPSLEKSAESLEA